MWIMTKIGFFSIVVGRAPGDVVCIRARSKAHLLALAASYPQYDLADIIEDESRDYRYRAVLARDLLPELMADIASDVDYTNFKSAAQIAMPDDPKYVAAMHNVWSAMANIQPTPPYGPAPAFATPAGPCRCAVPEIKVDNIGRYCGICRRNYVGAGYPPVAEPLTKSTKPSAAKRKRSKKRNVEYVLVTSAKAKTQPKLPF